MVDVMLVLLVIFMIASPMITMGVDITLPAAASAEVIEGDRLVVSVGREGEIYLSGDRIEAEESSGGELHRLLELVAARLRAGEGPDLIIEGDAGVAYGRVLEVMDALRVAREAGAGSPLSDLRVALVTAPAAPGDR
jgi:biopolymer transport protein TolR